MDKQYFDDYTVGEKFSTPSRTVTETDIVMFAALSGDWHPIHTDKEYAEKSVFGERIAHGLLGLILGSGLTFRLGNRGPLPKNFIAFYGMDKLRLTAPLKIGDTIHSEIEIMDLIAKDENKGVVKYKTEIKNQRDEVVSFHEIRILVARKPKESQGKQ
jgi:3-hydroxybutyryl-CoA dehydratase